MRKKLLMIVLVLAMVAALGISLSACNNDPPAEEKSIVFLGDSIAEALLGPSPLVERERYGYYALLGESTGYKAYNRSVSGHKTGDLIEIIKAEDEDAKMTRTRIKEADIIHISILGNDFLQNDLGKILIEAVESNISDPDSWFSQTIDDILHSNNRGKNGQNAEGSVANIANIVSRLKELNPNALLVFQKVYNPVSEGTTLISDQPTKDKLGNVVPSVRNQLLDLGYEPSEYRELAGHILDQLNGVLDDYLAEHPGAFEIVDAQTEFDRIYGEDPEMGKALIYKDYVHPSNYGHAVLADLSTRLFVEKGIVSADRALETYKDTRLEQLKRMYTGVDGVDVDAVGAQIKNAASVESVTDIYAKATLGKTPLYATGNDVADAASRGSHVDQTFYLCNPADTTNSTWLEFKTKTGDLAKIDSSLFSVILDINKSKLELRSDGTIKLNIVLKSGSEIISAIMDMLGGVPLDFDASGLVGGLESYLTEIIPGFDKTKIAASLSLLKTTLGAEFTGVDFNDPTDPVFTLLDKLLNDGFTGGDDTLENDLKNLSIPENFGIRFTGKYYIKNLTSGVTGKTYQAVHIGFRDIPEDPFLLLDISKDKDGNSIINGNVKFIKLTIKGSTKAPSAAAA